MMGSKSEHGTDVYDKEPFKNWVRAAIGIRIVGNGIRNSVSKHIGLLYNSIVLSCNGGKDILECKACTNKNLLPFHHKDGRHEPCKQHKGNTSFCKSKSGRRLCPSSFNQCSRVHDEIMDIHQNRTPNFDNVKVEDWSTNDWEIAKAFINCPGYGDAPSSEDTDTSGLLSVCLNVNKFEGKLQDKVCFKEVRRIRNAILHSSKQELTRQELDGYLEVMSRLLDDTWLVDEEIVDDNIKDSINEAKHGLEKLPALSFCANCTEILEATTEAIEACDKKVEELKEQINSNCTDQKLQIELAKTLTIISKHEERAALIQNHVLKAAIKFQQKRTMSYEIRQKTKSEFTKQQITTDQGLDELLEKAVPVCPEESETFISLASRIITAQKTSIRTGQGIEHGKYQATKEDTSESDKSLFQKTDEDMNETGDDQTFLKEESDLKNTNQIQNVKHVDGIEDQNENENRSLTERTLYDKIGRSSSSQSQTKELPFDQHHEIRLSHPYDFEHVTMGTCDGLTAAVGVIVNDDFKDDTHSQYGTENKFESKHETTNITAIVQRFEAFSNSKTPLAKTLKEKQHLLKNAHVQENAENKDIPKERQCHSNSLDEALITDSEGGNLKMKDTTNIHLPQRACPDLTSDACSNLHEIRQTNATGGKWPDKQGIVHENVAQEVRQPMYEETQQKVCEGNQPNVYGETPLAGKKKDIPFYTKKNNQM